MKNFRFRFCQVSEKFPLANDQIIHLCVMDYLMTNVLHIKDKSMDTHCILSICISKVSEDIEAR